MQKTHHTPAEVYWYRRGYHRCMVYRRFPTVGEAVQYAVEHLPRDVQLAAIIEVNEIRIGYKEFRKLYKNDVICCEKGI
jgi:hypothetical protein